LPLCVDGESRRREELNVGRLEALGVGRGDWRVGGFWVWVW